MNRICGVIDFDGFQVAGKFLVREFGFIGMDWKRGRSTRYDLTPYHTQLSRRDWNTVRYVENHVFGMPFYPLRGERVYHLPHLDTHLQEFYADCKTHKRKVIGYKGGYIEKDRLDNLNIPSVNLELFGCPKYDDLQCEQYNRIACRYHVNDVHCPRAEVTAFRDWVLS